MTGVASPIGSDTPTHFFSEVDIDPAKSAADASQSSSLLGELQTVTAGSATLTDLQRQAKEENGKTSEHQTANW
jgi:hypothetical protein